MKVIFSHGKESGPWGSKITALAEVAKQLGYAVDSIDYRVTDDPDARVEILNSYLVNEQSPFVLVGSSMGGYVSLVASQIHQPEGVFLLAPALFMPDYQHQEYSENLQANVLESIEVVHGWSDDIIPVENSIRFAQEANVSLHLIQGDHRLNTSLEQVKALFQVFLKGRA